MRIRRRLPGQHTSAATVMARSQSALLHSPESAAAHLPAHVRNQTAGIWRRPRPARQLSVARSAQRTGEHHIGAHAIEQGVTLPLSKRAADCSGRRHPERNGAIGAGSSKLPGYSLRVGPFRAPPDRERESPQPEAACGYGPMRCSQKGPLMRRAPPAPASTARHKRRQAVLWARWRSPRPPWRRKALPRTNKLLDTSARASRADEARDKSLDSVRADHGATLGRW